MDPDEYRRQSYEAWNRMAAGWERAQGRTERVATPVREWLVHALDPRPGETVLELAAGVGETGFDAARRVGPEGRLISADRSPAMVEVARRRSAELGLRNVEHRVLDAEEIELPGSSVDGVLCRWAYMLMADPLRALRETRRVLRPGGRLALAVWAAAERNPWVSIPGRMFAERGHVPAPEPGAPGMFALADEGRIPALLERAGFGDVRLEEVPVRFLHADVDEYIRDAREMGGLFSTVFADASEEERKSMRAELQESFEPYVVGGRLELPGVSLCAVAS